MPFCGRPTAELSGRPLINIFNSIPFSDLRPWDGCVALLLQVFGGFDELSAYAGPNFDELDNAVQTAFYEFLAG